MLQMTDQHIAAFSDAARRGFEDRMILHLAEHFPDQSAVLGVDGLRAVIRDAVERALGYGLRRESGVRGFLDLVFALGDGFDEDPVIPWASETLRDIRLTPEEKLGLLYDEAQRHLESHAQRKQAQ